VDNNIYPSDDLPQYLTVLISGHLIVPLLIVTDNAYALPTWLEGVIWLPAAAAMCLVLLPFMKGGTVGLCWATKLTRRDAET
jgi:uncharacterized protein (DUF983 family)